MNLYELFKNAHKYCVLILLVYYVLQIPYGGYLNTTFNNAPVQIVNYASEGFWQIGIGNN